MPAISTRKPRRAPGATCAAAGLVAPVLLEDCVLDVAILGDGTAAKVYTFKIPPRTVLPRPAL
jgi:hypothetical protein